jgi:hypothetical protein
MAQIFHESFNSLAKVSIAVAAVLGGGVVAIAWQANNTGWATDVDVPKEQPVQFSHDHHVQGLGIDCRYCHTSVDIAASAGIPSTKTCMSCHSQIWTNSEMLKVVRDSYAKDESIPWVRLHDLPEFVYFNHSVHVKKGVGCESCHGRVDQMPLMWKENTLNMSWCIDCHRNPEEHLRPAEDIYTMGFDPKAKYGKTQTELGEELVLANHVKTLTNCSTCHR